VVSLPASQANAQGVEAPYTLEEVRLLVASPMTEERIAQVLSEGCITFEMDAFTANELRAAGASLTLIRALNEACVRSEEVASPPAAAATPPPVPAPAAGEPAVVRATEATSPRAAMGPGFYGEATWVRLEYSSLDDTKSGGITWARMTSSAFQIALWGTAGRTETVGIGLGDVQLWDADTGLSLSLFLLRPRPELPVGLHVGALASFSRAWLSESFSDGTNRYRYGWEAGAFGRIGEGDIALVPRITYRSTRNQLLGDIETEPFDRDLVILGIELKLLGVVPGVFFQRSEGQSLTIVGLTFAF
jgi:hypothetical protein